MNNRDIVNNPIFNCDHCIDTGLIDGKFICDHCEKGMKKFKQEDEFECYKPLVPEKHIPYPESPDKIFIYKVTVGSEEIEINNRELCNLKAYQNEEIAMRDFLDNLNFVSGIITVYEELIDVAKNDLKKKEAKIYSQYRGQTWGSMYENKGTEKNKIVPEKVVLAYINSHLTDDLKEAREQVIWLEGKLRKLKNTFDLIKIAWETARSINANQRKLIP